MNLNDSNHYAFSIVAAAGSYATDRFYIVFRPATVVPVTFTAISALRQTDKTILIKWNTENELNIDHYTLQRSANGAAFIDIGNTAPANNSGSAALYQQTDSKPLQADNYYRIRALSSNNSAQYSTIVKVGPLEEAASITVYPNPIADGG